MRKSRAITLTVLSGLMLTGCCVSMSGCGRRSAGPPDRTWHDASGHPVAEKWKTDANGNRVLDEKGRPIPEPFPHDRYGQPWVYDSSGVLVPPPPAGSSSTYHSRSSGLWLWGGSGYRSTGGSSYRPAGGMTTKSGTSSPGRSSPSAAPSGSSISRGGFGSTGMGGGGS